MAAKKTSPSRAGPRTESAAAVDAFIADLEHPHKPAIENSWR